MVVWARSFMPFIAPLANRLHIKFSPRPFAAGVVPGPSWLPDLSTAACTPVLAAATLAHLRSFTPLRGPGLQSLPRQLADTGRFRWPATRMSFPAEHPGIQPPASSVGRGIHDFLAHSDRGTRPVCCRRHSVKEALHRRCGRVSAAADQHALETHTT